MIAEPASSDLHRTPPRLRARPKGRDERAHEARPADAGCRSSPCALSLSQAVVRLAGRPASSREGAVEIQLVNVDVRYPNAPLVEPTGRRRGPRLRDEPPPVLLLLPLQRLGRHGPRPQPGGVHGPGRGRQARARSGREGRIRAEGPRERAARPREPRRRGAGGGAGREALRRRGRLRLQHGGATRTPAHPRQLLRDLPLQCERKDPAGEPRRWDRRRRQPAGERRARDRVRGRLRCRDRRSAGGDCQSITGGAIVDAPGWPASERGRYFFADNVTGQVWSVAVSADRLSVQTGSRREVVRVGSGAPVSLRLGPEGDLYIAVLPGRIVKLAP